MKFLHVMIRVKDIEKSLKFYTELLDMNLTNEVRLDDATLYYLSDEDGQTQIELTYNDETPVEGYSVGSGFGHFAFHTNSSMDEFGEKMKSMGYKFIEEPFSLLGMRVAFLKDPDGYEIEVLSKD